MSLETLTVKLTAYQRGTLKDHYTSHRNKLLHKALAQPEQRLLTLRLDTEGAQKLLEQVEQDYSELPPSLNWKTRSLHTGMVQLRNALALFVRYGYTREGGESSV